MVWLAFAILAAVLGLAVVTDVRSRRISNSLILAGFAVGVLWQALAPAGRWAFDPVEPGAMGVWASLAGAVSLLIAFFPLYALRLMGAGDVKLMAVVGAFFGASATTWTHLVGVALAVLCAGGLLAGIRMMASGRAYAVWTNLRLILASCVMRPPVSGLSRFDARAHSADRMPYAVAIALGTLFYAVGKWTGWLRMI